MIDEDSVRKASSETFDMLRSAHPRISGREFDAIIGKRLERWEKETKTQIESRFPYKEELRELENSERDLSEGKTDRELLAEEISEYGSGDQSSFLQEIPDADEDRLSEIHSEFVSGWRREFDVKSIEWELSALERRRRQLVDSLGKWLELIESASNATEIFGLGAGVLWDTVPGEISDQDPSLIREWSEAFRTDPRVRRLCEILGRACSFERSEEDRQAPLSTDALVPDFSSREEIAGIDLGDRIEDLLPSELGLLDDPDTEVLFDLKYVERRLMCFSKQGYLDIRWDTEENVSRDGDERFAGPVIICVDTSGSMVGTPEYLAKALAFYISFRACSEKRRCYLINFSTDIETLDLTPPSGLKELISFLGRSFHGGTDIKPAMDRAVRMLSEEEYSKADVLVISDFVMPSDSFSYLMKDMADARERGCRFHSLSIGNFLFAPDLSRMFDECWHYEPSTGKVEDMKSR